MKVRFSHFTWPEIAEIQKQPNIIILPVGSTEQHGPHLPLNVDSCCPTYIAEKAAFLTNQEKKIVALVAPTVHYTEVATFDSYPGSIGVSVDTEANYILEIVTSFIENGFNNILVLNGHSSNMIPINTALRKATIKYSKAGIYGINWWSLGATTIKNTLKSKPCLHAEEMETSVSLVAQPVNVKMDKACSEYPTLSLSEKWATPDFYGLGKSVFYQSRNKYPKYGEGLGVMGDATKACRQTGEIIIDAVVKDLHDIIIEIVQSEKDFR
jgi:creatinine amidohydrolase